MSSTMETAIIACMVVGTMAAVFVGTFASISVVIGPKDKRPKKDNNISPGG